MVNGILSGGLVSTIHASPGLSVRYNLRGMRRIRQSAILLCFLAVLAHAAARKPLPARIDAVLTSPDLSRGFWGIEVVSLDSGKVLYSQNSDKLFTPASN